jgi:aminoglycoside phosphotransferase (APT) family kinase protein
VTGPATALLGFRPDVVMHWMVRHGLPVVAPLTVDRIGDGESNITCIARDASGQEWVLRRPPLGPRLDSAHDVAREYRILHALNGQPVPVPRAVGLIEDPAVGDTPVLIMSRIHGRVIRSRESLEAMSPQARRRCGFAMVEALAAVHAVDLVGVGLEGLASTMPYAQRQLKRWMRQAESGPERVPPTMRTLADRLVSTSPTQNETTLVHGDCHLLNVLLRDDGDVAALLDWELGTLGDPVGDLGTLLAYWPAAYPTGGAGPFDHCYVPELATIGELANHYAHITGRSAAHIGYWSGLAAWKIAVITKGVLERGIARGGPVKSREVLRRQIDTMLEWSGAALGS